MSNLRTLRQSIAYTPSQNVKAQASYAGSLPVIDPRDWQGKTVPQRQWFIEGLIPDRTVTNLSGDGGSGKTEVILQLIAAASLQTQWFGKDVSTGPCLYYGAEDEADELHRRLETIVRHEGKQLSDLAGIRLVPMAGQDAVLAEPDRKGMLAATPIFAKLEAETRSLRPKLVVIDPSADVFGGDEINRSQVRKFVSMLRGLAIDFDCAVLLLSHPPTARRVASSDRMLSHTPWARPCGWESWGNSAYHVFIELHLLIVAARLPALQVRRTVAF
jgi:RecA-family ATPase